MEDEGEKREYLVGRVRSRQPEGERAAQAVLEMLKSAGMSIELMPDKEIMLLTRMDGASLLNAYHGSLTHYGVRKSGGHSRRGLMPSGYGVYVSTDRARSETIAKQLNADFLSDKAVKDDVALRNSGKEGFKSAMGERFQLLLQEMNAELEGKTLAAKDSQSLSAFKQYYENRSTSDALNRQWERLVSRYPVPVHPAVYKVDIPAENGHNYLDCTGTLGAEGVDRLMVELEDRGWSLEDSTDQPRVWDELQATVAMRVTMEKDGHQIVLDSQMNMSQLASTLREAIEGDERDVADLLRRCGYRGFKLPSETKGEDGQSAYCSYVIFNDKEVKVREKAELLQRGKVVYGAAWAGKIYLNEDRLDADVPIHEYTHLWDKMVQRSNPELWARGVQLMKQMPQWNEVKRDPLYSDLRTDDEIASEVHARLAGREGKAFLEEVARYLPKLRPIVELVRDWLEQAMDCVKQTLALVGERVEGSRCQDLQLSAAT